jgi:aminoglycoside phosphotransferase family enzyme/predicted kinase
VRTPELPDLVRALLRPEAFSHPADHIQLHETHGAWVILAGSHAYKLKKPVDLGFFDFSTFERRAADAEAELRLNRRLAADTYLGLVDVVERDGQLCFGGEGRMLERAVHMRRLPDEGMLTALLERDEVPPALVQRIARTMVRFHREAATGPGVDEHGARATIEAHWDENFAQIEPFVDVSIPHDQLDLIRSYVQRFLNKCAELLDRRVAEGRVRDGHGDLHAASICIVKDEIVIFDCIEFSDAYRCADVAAEVAFLAMDLDHAGRPDLARAFVVEYVRRSGDRVLTELLDFYKCYRAFVRGKVLSFRLSQPGLPEVEREALTRSARAYFDLAIVYAGGAERPLLVVTCGVPGSGKSTVADELSRRLGMLVLSTDVIRKRRAGLHPTARAHRGVDQGIYRAEVTRLTYTAMREEASKWLRRGVSVVLDGTFADREQRRMARRAAEHAEARFLLVLTTCQEEVLRRRIDTRSKDPHRISDATWEIAQLIQRRFTPPDELPPAEVYLDPTGGGDADGVVHHLMKRHSQPFALSLSKGEPGADNIG